MSDLYVIIISLVKYYYRIFQTHHACMRVHTHVPPPQHTHRRCRRTGYRYSLAPNRDGPLRLRQCRSLAIQMYTVYIECFWHTYTKKFSAELRRELVTGCTVRRYKQLETSPEMIEQELRPAVCEHRQTDRLNENYSMRYTVFDLISGLFAYVILGKKNALISEPPQTFFFGSTLSVHYAICFIFYVL